MTYIYKLKKFRNWAYSGYLEGKLAKAGLKADRPVQSAGKIVNKLTQKETMPKNGRSVSRGRTQGRGTSVRMRSRTPSARTSSGSSIYGISRVRFPRDTNVRAGGSVIQHGAVRSGRRVSANPRKRTMKISKKFRKKVKEVIKATSPSGYYQERYYNKFTPVTAVQTVVDIGGGNLNSEFGTADGRLWFFDPARVINVASILFNGKTPTANKASSAGDATLGANLFDRSNIQIEMLRQWVEFHIKNNSARNMELKLWTWELKKPGVFAGSDTAASLGDFVAEWTNSFAAERLSTVTAGAGISTTGLNTIGITPTTIGASPSLSHAMRLKYNIEEKVILLEPGRTYKHQVQGPRMVYDFGKFNLGGSFVDGMKGIKGVCMGFMVDNTSTDTIGAGRSHHITSMDDDDGYGILVETIYNYVVRMPDQAGFKVPATMAAGTAVPLNYRRDKPYAIKIWNVPGGGDIGAVTEVNEENPVTSTFIAGT